MYGYGNGNGFNCGNYGVLGNWNFLIPIIILGITLYIVFKIFNQNSTNNKTILINQLNMKYINGELSEEEYIQKKKVISKK